MKRRKYVTHPVEQRDIHISHTYPVKHLKCNKSEKKKRKEILESKKKPMQNIEHEKKNKT